MIPITGVRPFLLVHPLWLVSSLDEFRRCKMLSPIHRSRRIRHSELLFKGHAITIPVCMPHYCTYFVPLITIFLADIKCRPNSYILYFIGMHFPRTGIACTSLAWRWRRYGEGQKHRGKVPAPAKNTARRLGLPSMVARPGTCFFCAISPAICRLSLVAEIQTVTCECDEGMQFIMSQPQCLRRRLDLSASFHDTHITLSIYP
jgi:hypothetical protein